MKLSFRKVRSAEAAHSVCFFVACGNSFVAAATFVALGGFLPGGKAAKLSRRLAAQNATIAK